MTLISWPPDIYKLAAHIIHCGFNLERTAYLWGEIPQHQPATGPVGAVSTPGGSLCNRNVDTVHYNMYCKVYNTPTCPISKIPDVIELNNFFCHIFLCQVLAVG